MNAPNDGWRAWTHGLGRAPLWATLACAALFGPLFDRSNSSYNTTMLVFLFVGVPAWALVSIVGASGELFARQRVGSGVWWMTGVVVFGSVPMTVAVCMAATHVLLFGPQAWRVQAAIGGDLLVAAMAGFLALRRRRGLVPSPDAEPQDHAIPEVFASLLCGGFGIGLVLARVAGL